MERETTVTSAGGQPLVALMGVRSKVRELSGRLEHCLSDLLLLQAEAEASNATSDAPMSTSSAASHGAGAKRPPSPAGSSHGSETWVRVSAHQRPPQHQQQPEAASILLNLPPADVSVGYGAAHDGVAAIGGGSSSVGSVARDSDGGGSSLEDDFEAQLRASEVLPPPHHSRQQPDEGTSPSSVPGGGHPYGAAGFVVPRLQVQAEEGSVSGVSETWAVAGEGRLLLDVADVAA